MSGFGLNMTAFSSEYDWIFISMTGDNLKSVLYNIMSTLHLPLYEISIFFLQIPYLSTFSVSISTSFTYMKILIQTYHISLTQKTHKHKANLFVGPHYPTYFGHSENWNHLFRLVGPPCIFAEKRSQLPDRIRPVQQGGSNCLTRWFQFYCNFLARWIFFVNFNFTLFFCIKHRIQTLQ